MRCVSPIPAKEGKDSQYLSLFCKALGRDEDKAEKNCNQPPTTHASANHTKQLGLPRIGGTETEAKTKGAWLSKGLLALCVCVRTQMGCCCFCVVSGQSGDSHWLVQFFWKDSEPRRTNWCNSVRYSMYLRGTSKAKVIDDGQMNSLYWQERSLHHTVTCISSRDDAE